MSVPLSTESAKTRGVGGQITYKTVHPAPAIRREKQYLSVSSLAEVRSEGVSGNSLQEWISLGRC